ncbi:MAG: DinB family protein [Cyclobacteriaceae bacterium]|nr:DinB family protein [Cyclobacteriaceae bacterium]
MNVQLKRRMALLESQRLALLNEIKDLNPAQLNRHEPGKWSLNQVFAHLIASEQLSISYLKKKTQGLKTLPDTGLAEDLKMFMLILSQRLPFKFKAPKIIVDNTPAYENAEQITEAWDKTRKELEEVLNLFADDQLNRKVYRHAVAGLLNIRQALRFFREHIIHHQPQVKRLLKDI